MKKILQVTLAMALAIVVPVIAMAAPLVASARMVAKDIGRLVHDRLFVFMFKSGMIMALNEFTKEEIVAFEDICEGFEDALTMSRNVTIYNTNSVEMERTNNIIWRPMPYIARSFDGTDQTANFNGQIQLSVPATLGYQKSSPWEMTATELRDALQNERLGEAARQKLASDINVAVLNVASLYGSLVVSRPNPATGYDDVAQAESLMNEQGVPGDGMRRIALASRDYNGMANNLQAASRSFGNAKSDNAFEDSYVGRVASFETFKLDYAKRIPAAAGSAITMSTLDGAVNYYVPQATRAADTGETSNVDNRFQVITVSSTTDVRAGDAFNVDDLYAVHHITKENTGQLKTFRVVSVQDSTHLVITPPMITNQVPTQASAQYQNCEIAAADKASNNDINWLNAVSAAANPFWHKSAIELLPGRYAVPTDAGAAVIRSTTAQGIELTWTKQFDIKTLKTFFRLDTFFGVCMLNPEMAGLMLFDQS